jgi:iron complex transport system substrate-binding protein
MRRLLLLLPLLLLLAACTTGSGEKQASSLSATPAVTSTAAASAYPLSVPASDGRTVTLSRRPERILSLSPGQTETLFAIGAGGQVVATDRFSDFPEAARALPKVEYTNPNVEAIVALRPDLVTAAVRQRALVPLLEQAGLKVLLLEEPGTVAGVIERIRLLGKVTDHTAQAEELAASLQARVTAVTQKVAGVGAGPRVYHEIDPKLYSASPSSFVGDLYTLLKAQNIAAGAGTAFPQLSAEAIIAADPEVIVLGDGMFPGGTVDDVRRRPGWSTISAVKNNRLYALEDSLVSRPGPRVVDGLEQVARLLYPDLFR